MNARPNKSSFENFEQALVASKDEIADLLPSTITWERMRNTIIAAVKATPDLLLLEQRYLKKAITQAAADGLMPDGKEGVIIIQNEKIKGKEGEKDTWIKTCRWQPMLYGIRKRARELSGMIIDAKVVFKNDTFDWEEGDNPYVHHKPVALDGDTGPLIGVYAHFRMGNDILHREVMRKTQVMAVKGISKQPNGLLWTTFEEEAWKKSAVRRGIKTVPCHPQLETIIKRFDDMHDITGDRNPLLEDGVVPRHLKLPQPTTEEVIPESLPEAAPQPETVESRPEPVRGRRPPPAPPKKKEETLSTILGDALAKGALMSALSECKTDNAVVKFQSDHAESIMNLNDDDREFVVEEIQKARRLFGGGN